MVNEKYVGQAKMKNRPTSALNFIVKDKSIKNKHLSDEISNFLTGLKNKEDDLQNQIDSLEIAGIAVSNEFGNDPHISISQKTMTEAINKLWERISEITGEQTQGIIMTVTPDYFISEDGCDIHITATTAGANGVFEEIKFFVNDVMIAEAVNVNFFETDTHIDETSVVMCKAKIVGIEYTQQKTITRHREYWIGAGTSYQYVMEHDTPKPIGEDMRNNFDVTCNEGDNIFIIMANTLRSGFERADMNGLEIPFIETTVRIPDEPTGEVYKVFTSENTYQAGTYNIDING